MREYACTMKMIPAYFVESCSTQYPFAGAQLLLVGVLLPFVEFGHLSVVNELLVVEFEYPSVVVQ